jgi:hypothetical protein
MMKFNQLVVFSIGSLALLSGCGSAGKTSDGASAASDSLVTTSTEPAGENCVGGGVAIVSGTDGDGDGVLASAEVERTDYVCANAELIETVSLKVGDKKCPTGGVRIV